LLKNIKSLVACIVVGLFVCLHSCIVAVVGDAMRCDFIFSIPMHSKHDCCVAVGIGCDGILLRCGIVVPK